MDWRWGQSNGRGEGACPVSASWPHHAFSSQWTELSETVREIKPSPELACAETLLILNQILNQGSQLRVKWLKVQG